MSEKLRTSEIRITMPKPPKAEIFKRKGGGVLTLGEFKIPGTQNNNRTITGASVNDEKEGNTLLSAIEINSLRTSEPPQLKIQMETASCGACANSWPKGRC